MFDARETQENQARTQGIPTTYAGVRFRSRLEARWAALFDLFGWPWEYEPIDLDGYIPDFVVRFPAGNVLVEVKPEMGAVSLAPHARKIAVGGWRGRFLIVGAALFRTTSHSVSLGITSDWLGFGRDIFDHAVLHRCLGCGMPSFHHESSGWECRVNGCEDGNALIEPFEFEDAREFWNRAAGKVQWRPGPDDLGGVR